jgi:hypothetical protein
MVGDVCFTREEWVVRKRWFGVACVVVTVGGFATVSSANQMNSLTRTDVVTVKAAPAGPVVSPEAPLAGGEDCGTATVIGGLPYTDFGTTAGALDDYDEVCPYTGSTSPDVVYAYTPSANETVDISVCTNGGDAFYDTKIYVYEGTCVTPSFACNDDSCQAPSYTAGAYNSELLGLSLTAGSTYYIVVDGYGGEEGDYNLVVEAGVPPPTCGDIGDPGFLIGQDVDGVGADWSAAVSGQASWQTSPFIVADSIDQAADPDWFDVTSINVWGLSLENSLGWTACDPTGMTFDVIFYEDAAGVPGTEICNLQSLPSTSSLTGFQYSGFDLYQFNIAAACDLATVGRKWMSVQSEPMTGDCAFLWMSSHDGDLFSPRDTDGDGVWETDYLYDSSMCINGSTIPVELESFTIE